MNAIIVADVGPLIIRIEREKDVFIAHLKAVFYAKEITTFEPI